MGRQIKRYNRSIKPWLEKGDIEKTHNEGKFLLMKDSLEQEKIKSLKR